MKRKVLDAVPVYIDDNMTRRYDFQQELLRQTQEIPVIDLAMLRAECQTEFQTE
jgi:hypothetical protein